MFPRAAAIFIIAALEAFAASGPWPLAFEPDQGQAETATAFLARAQGAAIHFAADGVSLASTHGVVRMKFDNANPAPAISGRRPQGTANYLVGDPEQWRTGIPLFEAVEYRNLYRGIDLVFYGNGRWLEYDFVVAPGARVSQIGLSFEGATELRIEDGDLVVITDSGELRHRRPRIYQRRRGRKSEVGGRFVLRGGLRAGFALESYDTSRELVIDPILEYGTYVGGGGSDQAHALAVDSAGAVYVAGETWPVGFPRTLHFSTSTGNQDAFLVKLNPAGTAIVYATYFGGRARDSARGVAVDASGSAYVTGFSSSADFPTTAGAHRYKAAGGEDAFVVKLNASGSGIVYSTLIGTAGSESATGIAVDGAGNAYISGFTNSLTFPVTSGAVQKTFGGLQDAFAVKLNPSGSALVYATYLGGQGNDVAKGIAVDASGFAYIAGFTDSSNFPVKNALRSAHAGQGDAFVARLSPAGDSLSYSSYLGGAQTDAALAIAVDASGSAYLAGSTFSPDFPVTAGAYQPVKKAGYDAFVAKLNLQGNALTYCTFLGGDGEDEASALAVDANGMAYVAGHTASLNFPAVQPADPDPKGGRDAFAAALSSDGAALAWSTYLGGAAEDRATAVAADAAGAAYIAGYTFSPDFRTTSGANRTVNAGGEAFVVKLGADPTPDVRSVEPASAGDTVVFTVGVSHAYGYASLSSVYLLFHTGESLSAGCLASYERASGALRLASDDGASWTGPVVAGSGSTLQNSQCTLYAAASSASGSGNTLTVNFGLRFKPAFAGQKQISVRAIDIAGVDSGWRALGSWTVPAAVNQPPSAVSVSPSSGTGMNQTFTFLFSDPNGASDLAFVGVWIGSTFKNSCYVFYHQPSNSISLLNDTDTGWLGPLSPAAAGVLQNSQCTVNAAGAMVATSGDVLTLTLPITFRAPFAGAKTVSLWAADLAGSTKNWQTLGAWSITAGNSAPVASSLTPASGTGLNATFAATFFDPDGASDLRDVGAWIGSTFKNSCYLLYTQASNGIYLLNDSDTGWIGPLIVGTVASVQNSQCVINGNGTSVSMSGGSLTLNLSITFRVAFSGSKPVSLRAADRAGLAINWQTKGTWNVTVSNSPPLITSVAPDHGTGLNARLVAHYADSDGAGDIAVAGVWIGSTFKNSCYLFYNRSDNSIYLLNDADTGWLGPLLLESDDSIQNSQCDIDGRDSFASAAGNTLSLHLSVTFRAGFAGNRTVSLFVGDQGGSTAGWSARGSWTIP